MIPIASIKNQRGPNQLDASAMRTSRTRFTTPHKIMMSAAVR